ncbi:probable 3',5'-cyclic phosphodiesterase pde-5 [Centruroides sculpturatus]|uniref:probable 3',5'-cyclic phosphodiesterase pde-5 n=1 Tax=Centruroides sculpturatus TaxID=218467 RepID=UPI000C6D9A01|nr:probable 3',5'-cyclic phosphodiesterase pde-5 [Centruroides sculpturatus]
MSIILDRELRKNALPRSNFQTNAKMLQELTKSIFSKSNKMQILSELSRTIATAVNASNWNLFYCEQPLQKIYSFDPEDNILKSIFKDMQTMDTVIIKIMMFAQKLVKADRASLFLVDHQTKELYARIFDVNCEENKSESANEIRIPLGSGIAGFVALTGQSLNIPDAYNDHRFNRSIDQLTGYVTRNLLCMPIYLRNTVIGVVQMVNKEEGLFNEEDEESFSIFSIYCGLALHHAKLYDKIRRSEQKYKVAIEVLRYHNACTDEEVERFKHITSPISCDELMNFYFSSYSLNGNEKVTSTTQMFIDLFGLQKFELDCLIRFTLTVRKNYRTVPYHNWNHGFSVANSSFVIIKSARGVFRPFEELALFISCLCHDLDHRGKTNQFLINSESPLAAIYTTSTLEHHHFNQTISILQQDGHNIFKHLTSEEYKQLLGNIKHCILATDLARFFQYKTKLQSLIEEDKFDWNNVDYRLLLEAVTMTACDLCASTKPWEQQKETVNVIFEEFYEQGDAEKAQGRQPIPMMDRNKPNEQAASQVNFLKGICVPCYELMYKLIPQTKPMIDGCL